MRVSPSQHTSHHQENIGKILFFVGDPHYITFTFDCRWEGEHPKMERMCQRHGRIISTCGISRIVMFAAIENEQRRIRRICTLVKWCQQVCDRSLKVVVCFECCWFMVRICVFSTIFPGDTQKKQTFKTQWQH